jgi:hypothetical protein
MQKEEEDRIRMRRQVQRDTRRGADEKFGFVRQRGRSRRDRRLPDIDLYEADWPQALNPDGTMDSPILFD